MADDPLIVLAAITGAHGVRGEVKLKLFAEDESSLTRLRRFDAGGRPLVLRALKHAGKSLVASFDGIDSRDAAEALKGVELAVPRSALPPLEDDEIYVADLIGRPAMLEDGTALGTIAAVENYGAGDLLEIERPGGKRFMVPFTAEAVPQVGAAVLLSRDFVEEE